MWHAAIVAVRLPFRGGRGAAPLGMAVEERRGNTPLFRNRTGVDADRDMTCMRVCRHWPWRSDFRGVVRRGRRHGSHRALRRTPRKTCAAANRGDTQTGAAGAKKAAGTEQMALLADRIANSGVRSLGFTMVRSGVVASAAPGLAACSSPGP